MNYNIQEELLREVKGLQCQNYSQINKLQTNLKSFILASENKGQRECNTNLWFNFTFSLNFIFFCFKLIITYYHTKNKGKQNLNQG